MSKTIVVSDKTWKKLVYIKTENNLKSMDDAIAFLFVEEIGEDKTENNRL